MCFLCYASGPVPLEDHPVRVQHLVRAPARRGRRRGVGADILIFLLCFVRPFAHYNVMGLLFLFPPEPEASSARALGDPLDVGGNFTVR